MTEALHNGRDNEIIKTRCDQYKFLMRQEVVKIATSQPEDLKDIISPAQAVVILNAAQELSELLQHHLKFKSKITHR